VPDRIRTIGPLASLRRRSVPFRLHCDARLSFNPTMGCPALREQEKLLAACKQDIKSHRFRDIWADHAIDGRRAALSGLGKIDLRGMHHVSIGDQLKVKERNLCLNCDRVCLKCGWDRLRIESASVASCWFNQLLIARVPLRTRGSWTRILPGAPLSRKKACRSAGLLFVQVGRQSSYHRRGQEGEGLLHPCPLPAYSVEKLFRAAFRLRSGDRRTLSRLPIVDPERFWEADFFTGQPTNYADWLCQQNQPKSGHLFHSTALPQSLLFRLLSISTLLPVPEEHWIQTRVSNLLQLAGKP